MPARSNQFQRLIFLIQKHLSSDARVRESAFLVDRITGAEREVDVVVEGQFGGFPTTLSLECRDRRRPADITWLDEMVAKHSRLPTNVLVLVSRSGFSAQARDVAQKHGVQLMTFEDIADSGVERVLNVVSSLWLKVYSLTVTKARFSVPPTDTLVGENVVVSPDNEVVLEDGTPFGVALDLVNVLRRLPELEQRFASEFKAEHKWFEFAVVEPRHSSGQRYCLRKTEPALLRPIGLVYVCGPCHVEIAQFSLGHAKLGELQVSWGTARLAGHDAVLVATKSTVGQKVTLTLAKDELGD